MNPAETSGAPTEVISGERLSEVLGLIEGADSVELKLTVPDEDRRSTVAALEIDPIEAELRQVVFFDTPDLALYGAGVVARARRTQGRHDDAVIKLRPVVPSDLPADLRATEGFGVEVDAMPGGFVCSASLKAELGHDPVRECLLGRRPVHKVFTKPQRELFAAHAPAGVGLDELAVLGPLVVLKLKYSPPGYGRRLVAELWLYPDGSHIFELSTKCRPDEAFQVAAETKAFLADRGVDLAGEQATKTRRALEFFSGELRADA